MRSAAGRDRLEVRFLSNIDGEAFDDAVCVLDPATTLVVAASKTFTTAETLANLDAALDWLREAGVDDPFGRVIAVTARPEAAVEAGIDETRILQFSEGVGGRYSLVERGRPVGRACARLGRVRGIARRRGGDGPPLPLRRAVEERRRCSPPSPTVSTFGRFGCQTRAVFAYDERLRLLPFYLQQLEMESNGKSVTIDGKPVDQPTAPVTWGGTGTDAQHAVFQLLHQGTVLVPVEFVAVTETEDSLPPRTSPAAAAQRFAQGAALMRGRQSDDPQRAYPGNRPSSTILLDRLDARTLGALIAFYEHRTFANAVLLGINPFDQFGVELGKEIARKLDESGATKASIRRREALIERAGL